MIPSQYYGADGRFDDTKVVVEDWEIAWARENGHGQASHRPVSVTRHNIALGKACGSYDPEAAWTWHIRKVLRERRAQAVAK